MITNPSKQCLLFLSIVFLLSTSSSLLRVSAKEFVASSEFQILDPLDTVPAGLHIRIDMTTGERWAKIAVAGEDDMQVAVPVHVTPDGDDAAEAALASLNAPPKAEDSYDYAMMHRMLSKLPEEEKEAMSDLGMSLPPLLLDDMARTSEDARLAWEVKMQKIWKYRQEKVNKAMETLVDYPEVLKAILKTLSSHATLDSATVVDALDALSQHVDDIDLARDFHTMGGWKLLSEILTILRRQHSNSNGKQLRRLFTDSVVHL
jgi:hypothetical protein